MLEILWTLINIGILIWVIVLFLRALKLVKREHNNTSAVVLFLGITFLFLGNLICEKSTNDFPPKHSTEYLHGEIKLSPINNLTLLIASDSTSKEYHYKTKLQSKFNFLIKPISWKPIMGGVNKTDTGYSYQILGLKEWNLFYIKIYSQEIELKGEIESKI